MKKSIALSGWLFSGALLIATPATAQESAPVEQTQTQTQTTELQKRVAVLLGGIERVPTVDDWAALGNAAVPVLVGVMNDTKSKIVTRGRAATGLGFFETAESAAALRATLAADSTPSLLIRKTMTALARVEGERSIDAIAPHLQHRAKRVREEAIKALGGLASSAARAQLTARLEAETSSYLRGLIATELQRGEAPVARPVENEVGVGAAE